MNYSCHPNLLENLQKGDLFVPFLHKGEKPQVNKACCEYLATHIPQKVLLSYKQYISVHAYFQPIVPELIILRPVSVV